MRMAIQWVLSLLFVIIIFTLMAVWGIVFTPWVIASRRGAYVACNSWAMMVRWLAKHMLGLESEIRGTPPEGGVLVAAKHQSFFDVLIIFTALPRGKFIMKKELTRVPVLGQFGLRIGCIAVDRGKGAQAVRKMVEDVESGLIDPGQLIIYPQGTRIKPGKKARYKSGTAALYEATGQECYPVACNVGMFWAKTGVLRKPGKAIVEFLPPIAPGLSQAEFMARLEHDIETASNKLMIEAGMLPEQIEGYVDEVD